MPALRSRSATAGVVAAVAVTVSALTLLPGAAPLAAGDELVPFAGCQELLGHYRAELERTASPWGGGGYPVMEAARAAEDSTAASAVAATGSGPTGTNLQEAGVDEPDTAKTVDGVLYAVAQGRLQVVRTGPQPVLLASLPLGADAWGGELLVQGDRVLVLVQAGAGPGIAESDVAIDSRVIGPVATGTRLVLVDVADPSSPAVLEQLELDGRYLSARLSEGAVRLVTSSSPVLDTVPIAEPYGPAEEQQALDAHRRLAREASLEAVLPQAVLRDARGEVVEQGPAVDCGDVRHAAQPQGVSTLLVSTLDLDAGLGARDTTAVTTDGDLVYASADRLYVATSRWGTVGPATSSTVPAGGEVTTELHAFDTTSPTSTAYLGSGSVDGYLLGRWALSSFEGHLRAATTSSAPWGDGPPSSSGITVLAESAGGLTEVGSVGGLGVGEQIFAVRYFGDLATVVTFRQTDPLYVLDLADPAAPRVLGELKIPGFSTYLHPVGQDRLLGVGMDADEQGRTTGFQVSLFDLSDRSAPVQLDRLSLGEGYSQAGDDSRAFGYDVERSTALLPFTSWTRTGSSSSALAVRVGDDGTLALAGQLPVGPETMVERVLHDGTAVYAITAEGVVAASPDALTRTGEARFGR